MPRDAAGCRGRGLTPPLVFREFDEHTAGGFGMQEGDAFSLGTNAGLFIDQREAGGSAPREGGVQIIHVEADVVNARPAFVEELSDRRLRFFWLQEFNERIASGEPRNAGAIGIVEGSFGEAEDVAIEGDQLVEGAYSNADVGDAGAATGLVRHEIGLRVCPRRVRGALIR